MSNWLRTGLTNSGQTGNQTHASVVLPPEPESNTYVFVVEAVGGTPTVTFKFQYSFDPTWVTDANSTWYDLEYVVPGAAETVSVATQTVTAVGSYPSFPLMGVCDRHRFKARLVTSANTNVTYRAEVVGRDTSS